MRTKNGIANILRRIMETGGMTGGMEDDIQALQSEFAQRDEILKRYGEEWDEKENEFDWQPKPIDDYHEKYTELESKYRELVERYNNRFFAGGDAHENDTELDENEVPDSTSDDIKIDDILVDVK